MRLKELRKENKKNQTEIANILNITQEKYSRLETEKTNIDLDTLICLADYYGVSLDYLCGRQNKNFFDVGLVDEKDKETITSYTTLDKENKTLAQSYIKGLRDAQRK